MFVQGISMRTRTGECAKSCRMRGALRPGRRVAASVTLLALIVTGCQGPSAPPAVSATTVAADPKEAAGGEEKKGAAVTLTPEQIKKLGLVTEAAKSAKYSREIP